MCILQEWLGRMASQNNCPSWAVHGIDRWSSQGDPPETQARKPRHFRLVRPEGRKNRYHGEHERRGGGTGKRRSVAALDESGATNDEGEAQPTRLFPTYRQLPSLTSHTDVCGMVCLHFPRHQPAELVQRENSFDIAPKFAHSS